MAFDTIPPALFERNGTPMQPEVLVSALLHLMSHYTANVGETGDCIKLASVIERHLKALAGLPEIAPVLGATCQQLSEQWATVVERAMPQSERPKLLTRLILGVRPH